MHRFLVILALALGLTLATPIVQVSADSDSADSDSGKKSKKGKKGKKAKQAKKVKGASASASPSQSGVRPASSGKSVPELDMTFAGSSVVLLLGGVAYFASRRREQE